MSELNNEYMDPQQYVTPAQPNYTAAPEPTEKPATAEPEVILQEIGFADYGFDEGDSVGGGHDFGGFMEDDNKEVDTLDGFNAFNSQTPNFDISEVEAASKAATAEEKAMFTATTVNFNLEDVESASKASSDDDRDIFSSSEAVGFKDITVSENPSFDAASAVFNKPEEPAPVVDAAPPVFTVSIPDEELPAEVVEAPAPVVEAEAPAMPTISDATFLASMQGMFASLSGTATPTPVAEVPVVETPVPVVEVPAAPVVEAPAAPVAEEPVAPAQPDIIVSKIAPAQTIQDISSTTPEEEKGPEYWSNIDKMLDNFDDGKHHQNVAQPVESEQPVAAPQMAGAPAFNLQAEPVVDLVEEVKEDEEEEVKSHFPFFKKRSDRK